MPLARKYGIISDIHANYQALKATLAYLDSAGVEELLCLGDLVGYGSEPFEFAADRTCEPLSGTMIVTSPAKETPACARPQPRCWSGPP